MCKREREKKNLREEEERVVACRRKRKKKKRMSKWEIPPKIWLAVVKITTKVEPISSMIDTEPTLPQKCKK